MALYVQTNVTSLNGQRNLTTATNALDTTYQRLSSGYRINSAKDDAAGLQISNRMTTQINGLNQANRNANDGIALAQTVEGAMDEMTNMYQTIRTLAVQSASGTYTSEDRVSMNQDVTEYSTEITRVSEKTTFNGQTVLTGKEAAEGSLLDAQGKISIQAGPYSYDYVSVDLSDGFSVLQTAKTALKNYYDDLGLLSTDSTDFTATSTLSGESTGLEVSTVSCSTFEVLFGTSSYYDQSTSAGVATDENGNIYMTSATYALLNSDGYGYEYTLDNESAATSTIQTDVNEDETITLDENNEVVLDADGTASGACALSLDAMFNLINGVSTSNGEDANCNNLLLGALMGIQIQAGTAELTGYEASAATGATAVCDVTTVANAQACIEWDDNFLAVIDAKRAELGAVQNRLESTISNQSNIAENVSDARSRIRDADYAEETANLSQQTIVQQASTTILTQANTRPQIALTLLGS